MAGLVNETSTIAEFLGVGTGSLTRSHTAMLRQVGRFAKGPLNHGLSPCHNPTITVGGQPGLQRQICLTSGTGREQTT